MNEYLSALLRILLSIILGGIIGFERAEKGRDAGIRTHIMVCLGATLVMLVNEHIIKSLNPAADPARLGAQVISGIGFLGVGCIITNGDKVKGLTTAAGLWTTACIGLAVGIGYYAISITVTVLMLAVMLGLTPLASKLNSRATDVSLHIKLSDKEKLYEILRKYNGSSLLQMKSDLSENLVRAVVNIPHAANPTDIIYEIASMNSILEVRIHSQKSLS